MKSWLSLCWQLNLIVSQYSIQNHPVPVFPHAGGVGLCEYVHHICVWDYISVSGSFENRMTEYVDHLHEHFIDPAKCSNGRYVVPKVPGYLVGMKPESIKKYQFPNGDYWKSVVKK